MDLNKKTKLIPGFNQYLIQEDGTIYSSVRNGFFEKIQPWLNKQSGYYQINLGRANRKTVHELVALAFIGPRTKATINHKDGNKLNNHYSNLEYSTYSENNRHAFKTGLKLPTKSVSRQKFSKEEVEHIMYQYRSLNVTITTLAKAYKVHFSTIHRLVTNRTYKNGFKNSTTKGEK